MNINKFKEEARIRASIFRHRGDVIAVSKELGLDIQFIKRFSDKIKKQTKYDVSFWVANSIMANLLMGYEQRNLYLKRCLDLLDKEAEKSVSSCCGADIELIRENGKILCGFCKKCEQECGIEKKLQTKIIKMVQDTISLMRQEDEAMVSFADKMGYTDKQPDIKQNILLINGNSRGEGRKAVDCQIEDSTRENLNSLSPREREMTRKQIEKYILETCSDDDADTKTKKA